MVIKVKGFNDSWIRDVDGQRSFEFVPRATNVKNTILAIIKSIKEFGDAITTVETNQEFLEGVCLKFQTGGKSKIVSNVEEMSELKWLLIEHQNIKVVYSKVYLPEPTRHQRHLHQVEQQQNQKKVFVREPWEDKKPHVVRY